MIAASRRVAGWLPVGALAAVCYVPLLLTHRGQVGADTKSYLTIDPGRLLERAWSMWDPNIGLGTVTHQNIGYLWPMGPWYWVFERARRARLDGPAPVARIDPVPGRPRRPLPHAHPRPGRARTSPRRCSSTRCRRTCCRSAARISAILLPFTALPWLIALTVLAIRERTWWYPALFALVIATIGSTNATALLARRARSRPVGAATRCSSPARRRSAQALGAVARIGVLTVGASLWWIAGLYCQGSYGIDILRYSETARTVAEASTAPEVLRGLGYWFFYGGDKVGPWIEPSVPYTQSLAPASSAPTCSRSSGCSPPA